MFVRGRTRRWRTTRGVVWHVGRKASGHVVTIPPGREFESSVPWFVPRFILDQDDPRFLLAALIHDYLLEAGVYGRPQAAAEWYDGALAGGAPRWQARMFYLAVAFWAVYKPEGRA